MLIDTVLIQISVIIFADMKQKIFLSKSFRKSTVRRQNEESLCESYIKHKRVWISDILSLYLQIHHTV